MSLWRYLKRKIILTLHNFSVCVCDQVSALALTTIAMVDHGPRVNLGVQGALNYEL